MATGKIEPTGCAVRKGKVQLRFSFYLEPGDARYEEHHVRVPVIPEGGYPGKAGIMGQPVDEAEYKTWIESLPKKWQNNPFHNHFVYVDAETTDTEIKQLLSDSLMEFYGIWSMGEEIQKVWRPKGLTVFGGKSEAKKQRCEARVSDIVKRVSEFETIRQVI